MQIVDALVKLLDAILRGEGLDPVNRVFGPDDNSVQSLIISLSANTKVMGAVTRQPLSTSMETDLGQAGDALSLTANLVRQYSAPVRDVPALLGAIIAAGNTAWEETDNVGEPAVVAHSLAASILVLSYLELAKHSDRTALLPAKTKIVPETVATIRNAYDRLKLWSPTRFSQIGTKTFYNIPGNGEISAVQYFYTFEGGRFWETDFGEEDGGAGQRLTERQRAHVQSAWAEIEAALQPATHAARVLERWVTTP